MDDEENKKPEPSEEKKEKQETPPPESEIFEFNRSRSDIYWTLVSPYARLYTPLIVINNIKNYVETNISGTVGDGGQTRTDSLQVGIQNGSNGVDKKEDAQAENDNPISKPSQLIHFNNADDVEEWFFSQSSVDNQIHLITVGVFAGNTQRFITETRERIKNLLRSSTKDTETESGLPAFTRSDSTILERTGTKIVESDFSVESGRTQLRTVEFVNPKYQEYVLQFFRSSGDIAKIRSVAERLLAQICQLDGIDIHTLGTPLIDPTRAQSAIGLGELAKSDYEHYLKNIIRPWANSPDPFLRFLVGWVLYALATEETHKSNVESLLTHWAKSKNRFLEWTSAAACSRFGLMDLDKTLEIVKSFFESDYKYTLHATRVSLSLLYFSGQNAFKIINALADWSENPELDRNKKHFIQDNLAFAFLHLVTDQIKDDIDDLENGDKKKENQKERMNIWLLLSKLPENEKNKLATSIAKLFNLSFKHQNAAVVDKACDILEKNMSMAESNWSKEILLVLQKIKANGGLGSKYIQIILKRPSLRKNQHLFSGSL